MKNFIAIIALIRWYFSTLRIKITKDYGMCCCEERALEAAWDHWCRHYGLGEE